MGFADGKCSAVKVFTIESGDGLLAFDVVHHLDKAESSGLSCLPFGHDIHTLNGSVICKERTDSFLRGPKTKVTYKDVFHFVSFC